MCTGQGNLMTQFSFIIKGEMEGGRGGRKVCISLSEKSGICLFKT